MARGWPPNYKYPGGRHNPKNKDAYQKGLKALRKHENRPGKKYKSPKICFYWEKEGQCRKGEKCVFQHPRPKIVAENPKGICWIWEKEKYCQYGTNCRYEHPQLEHVIKLPILDEKALMEQTELYQPVGNMYAPTRLLIDETLAIKMERLIIVDSINISPAVGANVSFSGSPTGDMIAVPPQECRFCSTCSSAKHSVDFSKKQWGNKGTRKCKLCQSAKSKIKKKQSKKPKK